MWKQEIHVYRAVRERWGSLCRHFAALKKYTDIRYSDYSDWLFDSSHLNRPGTLTREWGFCVLKYFFSNSVIYHLLGLELWLVLLNVFHHLFFLLYDKMLWIKKLWFFFVFTPNFVLLLIKLTEGKCDLVIPVWTYSHMLLTCNFIWKENSIH